MNIEVSDFFSAFFSGFKIVIFETLQPLYPIMLLAIIVGLIIGFIKGAFESFISTKIGAAIVLFVILGFLVKQGVF